MSESLTLSVITSPASPLPGPGNRTFAPTSCTLLAGSTEIAVVDAHFMSADIETVADAIAATGKRLTTILITHAHGDHYFGSARLVERFPTARIVSTETVARHLAEHFDREVAMFKAWFGPELVVPDGLPRIIVENEIAVDGVEVRLIDVGQGDMADCAIVHVPSLDAVVAGDVLYNDIHQMLGLSGPAEWNKWIESVDTIERLRPRVVVAGHKKPDAPDDTVAEILDGTRAYIRDFSAAAGEANSTEELVKAMLAKYPDRGNVTTLIFSASAAMKRKAQAVS